MTQVSRDPMGILDDDSDFFYGEDEIERSVLEFRPLPPCGARGLLEGKTLIFKEKFIRIYSEELKRRDLINDTLYVECDHNGAITISSSFECDEQLELTYEGQERYEDQITMLTISRPRIVSLSHYVYNQCIEAVKRQAVSDRS